MNVDPEMRQRMSAATAMAFAAMKYISEPGNWPAFTAWAEQHVPDETWTEDDRQHVARDSLFLGQLAGILAGESGAAS